MAHFVIKLEFSYDRYFILMLQYYLLSSSFDLFIFPSWFCFIFSNESMRKFLIETRNLEVFINKYKIFTLFWKSAPCIKTMIFDQGLDCWSSILLAFKFAATDTRSFGRRNNLRRILVHKKVFGLI